MGNKDCKSSRAYRNTRGIRKRQQNLKKAREAKLAARRENDNGNEGELDIEAAGLVQEPEGEIIFEAPNLVQEPGDGFIEAPGLVQEPDDEFVIEAPGLVQELVVANVHAPHSPSPVSPIGGAIQDFETPFMILGFLNKFLHLGRVRRGQKWVFAPEGARGMPEVSPTKMGGQSKVLKPLL